MSESQQRVIAAIVKSYMVREQLIYICSVSVPTVTVLSVVWLGVTHSVSPSIWKSKDLHIHYTFQQGEKWTVRWAGSILNGRGAFLSLVPFILQPLHQVQKSVRFICVRNVSPSWWIYMTIFVYDKSSPYLNSASCIISFFCNRCFSYFKSSKEYKLWGKRMLLM